MKKGRHYLKVKIIKCQTCGNWSREVVVSGMTRRGKEQLHSEIIIGFSCNLCGIKQEIQCLQK